MTLNRQGLRRINSPKSPHKRHNTSLRKKALVKKISGEVQFGNASKANLKVVVRVRPQNQKEEEKGARCVVDTLDEHMLVFDPKEEDNFFFKGTKQRMRDLSKRQPLDKKFAFERVFSETSNNEELYQATAHPLLDSLMAGFNCSVFAYGATGAGKTFTMLGKPDCPGIIALTLQELYRRLEEIKSEKRCQVSVSYLEVYNETVRDLLGTSNPLALQEVGHQVLVPKLSCHKPENAEELLQMLYRGNANRSQHATDANSESSRSHAVFQIFVEQQELSASSRANVTVSKLSMIDLAGSERGAATGFSGARFKEGSSINKSLLALGNCINALAEGQRHIPYRNSKLTRLLKDSLGGNCCSVMIATVSPASTSFEDTYNTLRYANRAKTIKTTIKNNVINVDQHVSNYVKIVESLKEEVTSLREKVKIYEEELEAKHSAAAPLTTTATEFSEEVLQERTKLEEQILELQRQLMEKETASTVSSEEAAVQTRLQECNLEQKALQWELLELESSYRTTELKLYHWNTRLSRVNVIAPASHKLDKTLNKCKRTIQTLTTCLAQMARRIDTVRGRLAANQTRLLAVREELNHWGQEPGQPSTNSEDLIKKHESRMAMRDRHQLEEHLRDLVKEEFREQHTSEQLIQVLLNAVKQFYLQFHIKQQCCEAVEQILKSVVEVLDESKITWADQQCVAEEEARGQVAAQTSAMHLKLDSYTYLPSLTPTHISPTVTSEPCVFRKSSIMVPGLPQCSANDLSMGASSMPATTNTLPTTSLSSMTKDTRHPADTEEDEKPLNITVTLTSPVLTTQEASLKFRGLSNTSVSSELLQDIHPLEYSLNTTFTPAKGLGSTISVDMASSSMPSTTMQQPTVTSTQFTHLTVPVSSVTTVMNQASTITTSCGPAVSRKSFLDSTAATLDTTFTKDNPTALANSCTLFNPTSSSSHVLSDSNRENRVRSSVCKALYSPNTTTRSPTSRSPLQPVKIFKSQGNSSRRGMSHTPYKTLGQRVTPGKAMWRGVRGEGMRRSLSTSSLTSTQPLPIKSSSNRKLKGLGGTLHRTTSFFRAKSIGGGSNQENVPPRKLQATSPSIHPHRSPLPISN